MTNTTVAPHLRHGLRAGATTLLIGIGTMSAAWVFIELRLVEMPPLNQLDAGGFVALIWLSAALVAVLAQARARHRRGPLALSGPHHIALVPARCAHDRELPALTYPVAVFALLAPLSLHSLFADAAGFLGWAAVSAVIVPHAHIVFAWLMVKDVTALLAAPGGRVAPRVARTALITSGVAAVPGALLMLLPPIFTGLTAVAILVPVYCLVRAARPWLVNTEA